MSRVSIYLLMGLGVYSDLKEAAIRAASNLATICSLLQRLSLSLSTARLSLPVCVKFKLLLHAIKTMFY